jgi:hypothetical protein
MPESSMSQSQRVLSWAGQDSTGVAFNNEDEDTGPGDVTYINVPERDWMDMGEPREITVTIEPGDMLNNPKRTDERPHSRACGIRPHEHGPECSTNCPTCQGSGSG